MFSIRLKELRESMGLSQQAFAHKLDISQSAVGMWESGKREPNFETIKRISVFFNCSTDYLLGLNVDSEDVRRMRLNLKSWLMKTPKTIEEIEKEISVNYHTLREWSKGYGDYFNDKISLLADLMDSSIDFLLNRVGYYSSKLPTQKEAEILDIFSNLDKERQNKVLGYASAQLQENNLYFIGYTAAFGGEKSKTIHTADEIRKINDAFDEDNKED